MPGCSCIVSRPGSLGASGRGTGYSLGAWGSQSQPFPRTEGSCGHSGVPGGCDLSTGPSLPKAEVRNHSHGMGWKLTSLGSPWWRGGELGSLVDLLETRPESAASFLCQQELGPSPRSPCPQIHLQKMARDRVRLGPWGSMLGRREELGAAPPWRSARLQGESMWREAINPMMAELEPRGQQRGSRRLP